MSAPLPENEVRRLAALRNYRVLDTLPESAFDDLTFLASQICGTPISLVTFINEDRQWFKSKQGLDISETSRDLSFCAHALLQPDDLFIVTNAREDERFADNPLVTGTPRIRFYAGAPLVTSDGEALGTICVIDNQPHYLSESQQQALRALARQVMSQLELRRNLIQVADEAVERVQTEAALRDSQELFRAFMDNIPIVAYLKDPEGRYSYVNRPFLKRFNLRLEQVLGKDDFALWPDVAPALREHDLSVLASEATVSQIESVRNRDRDQFWHTYKFPLQRGGGQGRFLGGVAVDITENKRFAKQLQEYQEKLEAALAKVQTQSLTDGLTGLNNRRAFDRRFEEELNRATRYGLLLSVLMIDVDKFKSYNDTFGHLAGDELLQKLGALLQETARATDFVARFGGEEFVILLPNTNRKGALLLAERFRHVVETMPEYKRAVTISVGASTAKSGMDDGVALLEAADRALYKAKQGGRNRVVQV